ncbi:149_t:CDS:2 [Dentiscutata erythropus]|uniref:149_t:CDS:1 n=1 Tax=Dentiscutata erythropus TaxID=1348616 RepID=A0A9N9ENJ1_9GLOM|nr:149_t:CDS:2 [Dentiscutata erythropus]
MSENTKYDPHLKSKHNEKIFKIVNDVATPFFPFIGAITNTLKSLLKTFRNAKCNRKICSALIDRVKIVKVAVESLQREQPGNEVFFQKQASYEAWIRFTAVLKNIEKFAEQVTQLPTVRKTFHSGGESIKETFDKNIKEFEEVCHELQFVLAIYSHAQREMESEKIISDIKNLTQIMNKFKDEVMNNLIQISIYKNCLEQPRIEGNINDSHGIDPLNIKECNRFKDSIFKGNYFGTQVVYR